MVISPFDPKGEGRLEGLRKQNGGVSRERPRYSVRVVVIRVNANANANAKRQRQCPGCCSLRALSEPDAFPFVRESTQTSF
jgi:hypothetical protein